MHDHRALETAANDSVAVGWVMALLLSLLQVFAWLSSMSGTTLGAGVVVLILLLMVIPPIVGVAFLCRHKPRMRKGFLVGVCVIWGSLILGVLALAFLMGAAYQGLGAR